MTELQKYYLPFFVVGVIIAILFIIMVIWSIVMAYLEIKEESEKKKNEKTK